MAAASKRRRKAAPTFEADHGPPERYRHGDVIVDSPTETAGVTAKRVMTQRVLDRYRQREQISERQYSAGDKLFGLWYRAGRSPVVTVNLAAVGGRDQASETKRLEAWDEMNLALRSVGLRLSPVLVDVCLSDQSAGAWARRNGQHPKAGITVLRLALSALGDFFGLARDPCSGM